METLQLSVALELEPRFVLPEWRSPMIGRKAELQRVRDLLLRSDVWLVTITGPGGVGKSRLAHAAASALQEEFDNAVAWVSLASASTAELAIETLARSLGVLSPGVETEQAIDRALEGRAALLVLDNVEQVPEFAPFIAGLAQANPRLKVLVTSRTPLRLGGEWDVALLPFPAPPSDQRVALRAADLAGNEAVQLFVERAQAIDQSFALTDENAAAVAEICSRLDGLPLAIELAAARVRLLPPEALAPRMTQSLDLLTTGPRDAPVRHQTLRNTIRWSYDLLSVEEQELFRRLSVFSGGFSLDAAQTICGAGMDTLDLVSRLLDHSLVIRIDRPGEPRFLMLETIRTFAADLLTDDGEQKAVHDAHAMYFATHIARTHGADSRKSDSLDLIDREIGNIRAAMTWLESERNAELLVSMCVSMSDWWQMRGTIREARAWFERALAIDAPLSVDIRLEGLLNSAWFASLSGDYAEARRLIDLAQKEDVASASVLTQIANETVQGAILFHEAEFQQSLMHMERAQALVERAGLQSRKTSVRFNLGVIAKVLDDLETARFHHEQGLREISDPNMRSMHAVTLADLDLLAGDFAGAARNLAEAWPVAFESRYGITMTAAMVTKGELLLRTGQAEWGIALLTAAEEMRVRSGWSLSPYEETEYASIIDRGREQLTSSEFDRAVAAGKAMSMADIDAEMRSATPVAPVGTHKPGEAPENSRGLTARELDVLRLLIDGKTNPEIADDLFISERTVQTHVARILQKLGVSSRTAAATVAVRDQIV